MTDLASLVLGIPNVIEGLVKTCRAVEAFENVEQKHRQIVQDVTFYSTKLRYYACIVDCAALQNAEAIASIEASWKDEWNILGTGSDNPQIVVQDSKKFLLELFLDSLAALDAAKEVIEQWTVRLKINVEDRGRRRFFVARLALAISDYATTRVRVSGRKKEKSTASRFYGKTAYLVTGSRKIEDAMGRLRHWLQQLHDILLVSPLLRCDLTIKTADMLTGGNGYDDDVLFIAMARRRAGCKQSMKPIKPELISSLHPLDPRKPNGLLLVDSKDSPFHGCIVDRRNILHFWRKGKEDEALKNTELIARLFAEEHNDLGHDISITAGVLPCCGFATLSPHYHDLVFRISGGTRRPKTLRSLLLEGSPRHSLDERLKLCARLASTVLVIHSLRVVHKDIRPDSIVIIDQISGLQTSDSDPSLLGEPYLLSFNVSRSIDSSTEPLDPSQYKEVRWASLYTHPRHLSGPHRPFEMRDDIYSLGICFLEIAMWSSLFMWDDDEKAYVNDTAVCDLSQERYDKMLDDAGEYMYRNSSWLRHRDLVLLAEQRIPITMGNAFKNIVVECLTFGMKRRTPQEIIHSRNPDQGQNYFRNQSIAFIQNVLTKLRDIKLS